MPGAPKRGLAHHEVRGFRLARIAIDREQQGKTLGGQLLLTAAKRCLLAAASVGATMLVIDAKNDRAAAWYASYGAIALLDAQEPWFCPLLRLKTC